MKKSRSAIEAPLCSKNPRKWRFFFFLLLLAVAVLYLISIAVFSRTGDVEGDSPFFISSNEDDPKPVKDAALTRPRISYGRITSEIMRRRNRRFSWSGNLTILETMAENAWSLGSKAWKEIENFELSDGDEKEAEAEPCPSSVSVDRGKKKVKMGLETEEGMSLPCGLEVGSSITVVGVPDKARREYVPELMKRRMRGGGGGDGWVMVSQFMLELQGTKVSESEEPPKVLHFNPRLKGDWSGNPVIELNTCYRMQWAKSMRCDGVASGGGDEDKGLIFALLLFSFMTREF